MKTWTLVFLLPIMTGVASAADTECLSCHTEKASAKASVHGGGGCTGCHTEIKGYPHQTVKKVVVGGITVEQTAQVNCANCHAAGASDLASSVHARVGRQPCLSCHGDAHAILPASNPKSSVFPSNLPKTCGTCHQNAELAKQYGLTPVYAMYMDSIHGFALTNEGLLVAASCSSCHGSHRILSAKNPASRTYAANIPATCGACHAKPLQDYSSGIHGQLLAAGDAAAPVCTNCHTAHEIAKVGNTQWQMKTTATCGGCHTEQFATYRDTFHAQVSSLGFQQTARCWDCHGEHAILPASDPNSKVAPAHLIQTCGQCHKGANASFVKYDPHADSHDSKHYPALHYSAVFMNLLLASVLGFFALHTVLWFLRSRFNRQTGVGPKESLPK